MHANISLKMLSADTEFEHFNTYNESIQLNSDKVQVLTEAQIQGTQRKHHQGPRLCRQKKHPYLQGI